MAGVVCLGLLFAAGGFLGMQLLGQAACGFSVMQEGRKLPDLYGRTLADAREATAEEAPCIRLEVEGERPCTDVPPGRVVEPVGQYTYRATLDVILSREPTREERKALRVTREELRDVLFGPFTDHDVLSAQRRCAGDIRVELEAPDGGRLIIRQRTDTSGAVVP